MKLELSRLLCNRMPHEVQLLKGFCERGNETEQTRQAKTQSKFSAF